MADMRLADSMADEDDFWLLLLLLWLLVLVSIADDDETCHKYGINSKVKIPKMNLGFVR